VLWAYDYFSKAHLLKLTGPATANLNQPTTVNVVDGQNGQPLSGVSVGATTTDADGNARVTFTTAGTQSLKSSRSDSVRSNRLDVCVHNGNDGTCGTSAPAPPPPPPPPPSPPLGRIVQPRNGQHFRHGRGPRWLRGSVTPGAGGLKMVLIRLERKRHGHCTAFDGHLARFRAIRCGARHAPWFYVGAAPDFSLVLSHQLRDGTYVMDIGAVDRAGRADGSLQRGRSRIVFSVG
jgi:hypothetical protein